MTTLYNLRTTELGYRITKFDSDLNPSSSYNLTKDKRTVGWLCDCPQNQRSTCRHRKMLPTFIAAKHIDDGWFLRFEDGTWHRPYVDPEFVQSRVVPIAAVSEALPAGQPVFVGSHDGIPILEVDELPAIDPVEPSSSPLAGEGLEPFTHAAKLSSSPQPVDHSEAIFAADLKLNGPAPGAPISAPAPGLRRRL